MFSKVPSSNLIVKETARVAVIGYPGTELIGYPKTGARVFLGDRRPSGGQRSAGGSRFPADAEVHITSMVPPDSGPRVAH